MKTVWRKIDGKCPSSRCFYDALVIFLACPLTVGERMWSVRSLCIAATVQFAYCRTANRRVRLKAYSRAFCWVMNYTFNVIERLKYAVFLAGLVVLWNIQAVVMNERKTKTQTSSSVVSARIETVVAYHVRGYYTASRCSARPLLYIPCALCVERLSRLELTFQ
jgi:hypothetical protein